MQRTFIGLGSNLNHPLSQINQAILQLKLLPQTTFIRASSFYQTKPVGFADQPDFVNAVVEIATVLEPHALLMQLQNIEQRQGRFRNGELNQPRTLDLDLLLYGTLILQDKNLTIPHPRLHQRAFVLIPLLEIAENLVLPDGKNLQCYVKQLNIDGCIIKLSNVVLDQIR
jgi:2-amino-4-hydroxy-6-hydroxymethyldihydropteridine diphosphokinase